MSKAEDITALLERMIPGFTALVQQGLNDSDPALMRGCIPQEVVDALAKYFEPMESGFAKFHKEQAAKDNFTSQGETAAQNWNNLAGDCANLSPEQIRKLDDFNDDVARSNLSPSETRESYQAKVCRLTERWQFSAIPAISRDLSILKRKAERMT